MRKPKEAVPKEAVKGLQSIPIPKKKVKKEVIPAKLVGVVPQAQQEVEKKYKKVKEEYVAAYKGYREALKDIHATEKASRIAKRAQYDEKEIPVEKPVAASFPIPTKRSSAKKGGRRLRIMNQI